MNISYINVLANENFTVEVGLKVSCVKTCDQNGSGNMNIYILIIYRRGNEISVHFLPRMHIRNICGFGDKNAYIRGIIYSEGKKRYI